jgi:hypothetical protein
MTQKFCLCDQTFLLANAFACVVEVLPKLCLLSTKMLFEKSKFDT